MERQPGPAAKNHLLPRQLTRFVGRETELAEIVRLLADPACSLLTLVGPGGIGKTRLALQAADRLLDPSNLVAAQDFADGVYFVPLQAVSSAEFLVLAIIESFGSDGYPHSASIRGGG